MSETKLSELMSEINNTFKKEEDDTVENSVLLSNKTNVVSSEKLRKIQLKTLAETADYLSKTFGPMGSNTKIIKGASINEITSSYSKDGLKVLSNIINGNPIEASIVEELISVTKAVEKEVGDGTTSTVILSSLIFDKLTSIQNKYNIPPYKLMRKFQAIVDKIKDLILKDGRECTIDDIYDISMVSTNGNEEVSTNIKNIYKDYGMDVELSVGISNNSNSMVKIYDGLTITEGMSDPVFINNRSNNTSEIHNARIYHFADPIDDMGMVALFESIITHNIYEPAENDEAPIPTVITCPRFSRDMSSVLKRLETLLYQYDNASAENNKPPILIISNVVASDEIIMDDISNLCGCKSIRKYIDPEIHKADIEKGEAPTVDTIADNFYGEAELVVADSSKTKFINPKHMTINSDGEVKEDPVYTAMINFLTTEIENTKASDDAHTIGLLKKRLAALKSNMVDYLVGGVTIAERDAIKDLVEDAVKNCKSASLYGVGYAANFEGLINSYKIASSEQFEDEVDKEIAYSIFSSYYDITSILYNTVEYDKSKVDLAIYKSVEKGYPFDISDGSINQENKNILCSIMLDINILDTISKIITMMCTSNQCLLQASHINTY